MTNRDTAAATLGHAVESEAALPQTVGIKFSKGDRVSIVDGFAYVGSLATVEAVSKDWSGIISYRLKEVPGWWPQSSLRLTKL